jgi:hypothetical protein
MALKVKANEKLQKIGKYADTYRYVMQPELYTALSQDKVIREAALRGRGFGDFFLCFFLEVSEIFPTFAPCIPVYGHYYLLNN